MVGQMVKYLDDLMQHFYGNQYNFAIKGYTVEHPTWTPRQRNGFDCCVHVMVHMQEMFNNTSMAET